MSHAAEPQSSQGLPIADPTPIGLICLAIGCAALVPIAFGASLTPSGLKTAAMFCLLFGAGGQLVAGLGSLLNRNLYGGTLFTSFAFNWVINWWALDSLSRGQVPDATVVFAVDVCFLIVFLAFTYGFGFFSSLLMAFLVDIDLLYIARIAQASRRRRLAGLRHRPLHDRARRDLALDRVRAAHQPGGRPRGVRVPRPGVPAETLRGARMTPTGPPVAHRRPRGARRFPESTTSIS